MLIKYLFLLLLFYLGNSNGLNLYLSRPEVQRLLGLQAELFYVRNDRINEFALKFVVPVPLKHESLQFTWENESPSSIYYTMDVTTDNDQALLPINTNISSSGSVPSTPETFLIACKCSGLVAADVNIAISISLNLTAENQTNFLLYRKKICSKIDNEDPYVEYSPIYSNSSNVFFGALACALAFIIVLVIIVIIYYARGNKLPRNGVRNDVHNTFLTNVPRNAANASYGSFRRMTSYSLISERSKDLQERIAELTVQRCRVRLNSVILEGTFGRVYKGTFTNEENVEETVIVKTVTDHASQVQISLLLQEGMSMYSLNHKNILSIFRVSIEDHTEPFLLYAHNNYNNLKMFLQKCKLSPEGVSHTLTTQEVVDMALQIVQALQYLHKKQLLHKDLAARNCMVNEKLTIKVADNALSRDLFPSDYHCLGDNENRPIKWMAIESLVHKAFSPHSDVWAFGVLLWELTTLAQQPYIEIDPFEMAAYLKDGYRLAQPVNCPDELFAVMAYCWAISVEDRPTISQLQICLQDFYTQLTRYV